MADASADVNRPARRLRMKRARAAAGLLVLATVSGAVVHLVGQQPPGRVVSAKAASSTSVIPVDPKLLGPAPVPTPPPLAIDWVFQHGQSNLAIGAQSAILVDADTREVLWARDERARRAPASLTKMITAMVAADLAPSLDQRLTVPPEVASLESDSTFMGVTPGEVLTVRELMYGMFLISGNDAAETLARGLVPYDQFVQLMNDKAARLGMRDSHFTNPTGLDDPALRATAYDLAVAGLAIATRYPGIMAVAGTKEMVLARSDDHKAFAMHTFIRLVGTYPGATGLKTGYTDDAGYCLVVTATRGDRHLVAALMAGDLGLSADAVKLLDYGFGQPRPVPFDPSAFPNV